MILFEAPEFFNPNNDCTKVQFPFNQPHDPVDGIDREEQYLDETKLEDCLYKECIPANEQKPMNFNKGIVRTIARLVAPYTMANLKGYGGYGFSQDGNFYADYWDGTADDFNKKIQVSSSDYSKDAHTILKVNGKNKKLSAFIYDENGNPSTYLLNCKASKYTAKVNKHSGSAAVFALVAYIITACHENKLKDPVSKKFTRHFDVLVDCLNSSASVTDIATALRVVDNDIYTIFAKDAEVKNIYGGSPLNILLYENQTIAELTPQDVNGLKYDNFKGDSEILQARSTIKTTGGFVEQENIETIGEILKKDANRFALNPSRVLTPEEEAMVPNKSEMIPNKEVLKKAEYIKKSTDLPRPFRNLLWTGETGSGKSTASAMLAQLLHRPYTFMTFNPDTILSDLYVNVLPESKKAYEKDFEALTSSMPSPSDIALDPVTSLENLTGVRKEDATEEDCTKAIAKKYYDLISHSTNFMYVESPLVKAFRYGYVCELQEVNVCSKPGVLSGINAALDDLATIQLPTGETIKRHPDCVIIMTANVGYEGTRPINQAVRSRCSLMGNFELPSEENMVELIKVDSGYQEDAIIHDMIKVMYEMRRVLSEAGETQGCCGIREIVAWAQASVIDEPYEAAMHTIVPKCTSDPDIQVDIEGALATYFVKENI